MEEVIKGGECMEEGSWLDVTRREIEKKEVKIEEGEDREWSSGERRMAEEILVKEGT